MPTHALAVRFARLAAPLLLAAHASAQGQVLVVDPVAGPGVDFTQVGAAVAAAGDGDTILVHAGNYASAVSVVGKSLSIVVRPGDVATLSGSVEVVGIAPGQFVSLAGLSLTRELSLETCPGTVWLQDCSLTGENVIVFLPPFPPVVSGGDALEVVDCASVALIRCSLQGGFVAHPAGDAFGGHGLRSEHSNLWLFDVSSVGGAASSCPDLCAALPGNGVEITGGSLYSAGGALEGHYGIRLFSQPVLWLLDTTVVSTGFENPPITGFGSVTELAGSDRDFSLTTPVNEHAPLAVDLAGEAGDSVFVFLGLQPSAVMSLKFHGPLMVPPLVIGTLGSLPPGGALSLQTTAPGLTPGVESLAVVLQAAFVDVQGAGWLSDPARLVVLAAQF